MAVFEQQSVSQPMSKLFIIPCCARKRPGGEQVDTYQDRLVDVVSPGIQENVISARANVLAGLQNEQKYLSGKYDKNKSIQDGPDFGGFGFLCLALGYHADDYSFKFFWP